MITGHGVDIIGMDKIRQMWDKMGPAVARHVLGPAEQQTLDEIMASDKQLGLYYLAKRLAAKEAFYKALGTGMVPPYTWQDAELLNDEHGKPYLKFNGMTQVTMADMVALVSVSDHSDMVIGSVIIAKR